MHFRNFVIISPWKRAGTFIWTNLKPPPKDALCQVWLKLAKWFWRRRFFNFVNVFSLFFNYLPLEKGRALHLINLNPLHSRIYFVPSLVEIGSVVFEKLKIGQVYRQTVRRTDWQTDRRRTTSDQKISLELSAQGELKILGW
mgnify:CR=1 FL=1